MTVPGQGIPLIAFEMVDQELLLEGYCFILQSLHAADPFGTTIRKPKLDNTLRERLIDQIVREKFPESFDGNILETCPRNLRHDL